MYLEPWQYIKLEHDSNGVHYSNGPLTWSPGCTWSWSFTVMVYQKIVKLAFVEMNQFGVNEQRELRCLLLPNIDPK
jgi:hypothetical protein